ncbi:hypothetical protein, partial [uncultured Porphyromonas sp.]|uniref:hypothetical protein n=1 Tax=uncultured Porphyromonas sp. TaxID=159274 RepID=UPI0028049763
STERPYTGLLVSLFDNGRHPARHSRASLQPLLVHPFSPSSRWLRSSPIAPIVPIPSLTSNL